LNKRTTFVIATFPDSNSNLNQNLRKTKVVEIFRGLNKIPRGLVKI
jgi:hypothetical protein